MNTLRSTLSPRRLAAGCCLGGCLLLPLEALLTSTASGDEPSVFRASAAADGVRVTVSAPGFLVAETLADGGAPVAQAVVDGLGTSRAFASLPYPGEAVLTTPSLLATSGGLPAPPAYPFVASSVFPATPESTVDGPGHRLSATSEAAGSSALATAGGGPAAPASGQGFLSGVRASGPPPGRGGADTWAATTAPGVSGALPPTAAVSTATSSETDGDAAGPTIGTSTATARAARDDASGAVRAESTSQARGVDIAGVLSIGAVTARAAVNRTPGGELVREAAFSADAVTAGGQRLAVTDQGLTVPGSGLPLADTSPAAKALADAGVSVRYLARVDDADGVISPGLVVTQRRQVPGGPVVITELVFGRAVAHGATGSATAAASLDLPGVSPATPAGPGTDAGQPSTPSLPDPASARATAEQPLPLAVPGRRTGAPSGAPCPGHQGSEARHEYFAPCFGTSDPSAALPVAAEQPAAAAPDGAPPPLESAMPASIGRVYPGPSTRASYAVIVAGGAVVAVLSQLVRKFGVRS